MLNIGTDFSGVGAFEEALKRLQIPFKSVFACDMDKYARITYLANHKSPEYFPFDVYDRLIPKKSLDIYVSSPPCQAFSLAGKRLGEDDKRGILFYNSHQFIKKNKPRFFIFENVKGLLSDGKKEKTNKYGQTFQNWLTLLGGKSINGVPTVFPFDDAVPYHIYFRVLNAKEYGIPQNRERVFIVGIKNDVDNVFSWPRTFPLTKKLKDVLEKNVDEKYFLSDATIRNILHHKRNVSFLDDEKMTTNTIISGYAKNPRDGEYLKVKSATKKGYEIATENDSVNLSNLSSKTRRGRVGKQVAQTLDTACKQGVLIGAIRGRNTQNPSSRKTGDNLNQTLELNFNETSNTLSSVQKDNVVVTKNYLQWDVSGKGYKSQQDRAHFIDGSMCTIPSGRTQNKVNILLNDYKIRRLTPRECFRLMDFPDTFKMPCSDTQMYKQAGNSIVVNVFVQILQQLAIIKPYIN